MVWRWDTVRSTTVAGDTSETNMTEAVTEMLNAKKWAWSDEGVVFLYYIKTQKDHLWNQ